MRIHFLKNDIPFEQIQKLISQGHILDVKQKDVHLSVYLKLDVQQIKSIFQLHLK